MRTYGQFCPIARASEVLAERWTPIVLRNLLLGCTTFNEIAAGAPGLSRALLTKRLHELERVGLIKIGPKPGGRGSLYEVTPAGQALQAVLDAMGGWADKWMDVTFEHSDPDVVLWSWINFFWRDDHVPDGRVVVRFEVAYGGRRVRHWLLVQDKDPEICRRHPGFAEDLVVEIEDPQVFAQWHLGLVEWDEALRSGIRVLGRRDLARALPAWNAGPLPEARGAGVPAKPAPSPCGSLRSAVPTQRATITRSSRPMIPEFHGTVLTPGSRGVRGRWPTSAGGVDP